MATKKIDNTVVDDMLVAPVKVGKGEREQGYYVNEEGQVVPVWKYRNKKKGIEAWRAVQPLDAKTTYPPPPDMVNVSQEQYIGERQKYGYQPKETGSFMGNLQANESASRENLMSQYQQMFTNPAEAMDGLQSLGIGAMHGGMLPEDSPNRQMYESFVDRNQERFGTPIETLSKDPYGAIIGDVGGLLSPTKYGKLFDPISAAGVVAKGVLPIASTAERVMASSLKPQSRGALDAAETAQRKAVAQKALQLSDTGLNVSPTISGLESINKRMAIYGEFIDSRINDLNSNGARQAITPNEYLKGVREMVDDISSNQPAAPVQAISGEVWSPQNQGLELLASLEDNLIQQFGGNMSIPEAQRLKTQLYNVLKDKYGINAMTPEGFATTANKSVARSVKEAVAERFPELSATNAEYGNLASIYKTIDKAVSKHLNQNLVSYGLGEGVRNSIIFNRPVIGIAVSTIKSVLDSPAMKARLAVALYKARNAKRPIAQKGLLAGQEATRQKGFAAIMNEVKSKTGGEEQEVLDQYLQQGGQ